LKDGGGKFEGKRKKGRVEESAYWAVGPTQKRETKT
jgi:hypothetical protein